MFYYANNFNESLNNWNVSNVTNMKDLFYKDYVFNHSLNNWNVSNVTSYNYFNDNSILNDRHIPDFE